eukprot:COSAG06_NODE_1124_length_10620_cov_48.182587_7_plen_191_part_00
MAAHNPALTQLLAALNAAPHAGMGNDFFAHVGSSLALARSVPPEWFPRSGTATAAQIGGLIARLHTLTTVACNTATGWSPRRHVRTVSLVRRQCRGRLGPVRAEVAAAPVRNVGRIPLGRRSRKGGSQPLGQRDHTRASRGCRDPAWSRLCAAMITRLRSSFFLRGFVGKASTVTYLAIRESWSLPRQHI